MRKKGRNKKLIALRNKKLLLRWYYWTEVVRLRLDDALTVLSEQEFFLSEDTIMTVIRNNPHLLPDATQPADTKKLRSSKTQLCLFPGE